MSDAEPHLFLEAVDLSPLGGTGNARLPDGLASLVARALEAALGAAGPHVGDPLPTVGLRPAQASPAAPPPLPELHVLSSPDAHALFHPPTHTLFRTDARTAAILRACKDHQGDVDQAAAEHGVAPGELAALLGRIGRAVASRPAVRSGEPPGSLRRLTLNVSSDCNMNCRYCYAGGGAYGRKRALMTPETARTAIDLFLTHYARVGTVMFFGGEPTLNPAAMRAACERALDLCEQGAVRHLPLWGMVTNGLALDGETEALVHRHDVVVTVSLDGPAEVHDRLRPAAGGGATFEQVARTIRRLQEATGGREPSRIEATYTPLHREAGLAPRDLADVFERRFGIDDVLVSTVAVAPTHPLHWRPQAEDIDAVRQAAVAMLDSWLTGRPRQMLSATRCLSRLVTHQGSRLLCDAGLAELTVMANGDVYPCFVLVDDDLAMGHVTDPGLFADPRFQAVQRRLRDALAKADLPRCANCWARHLCRACAGAIRAENETLNRVPDGLCAANRAVAEAVLLALCRFEADPGAWAAFCGTADDLRASNTARHRRQPRV